MENIGRGAFGRPVELPSLLYQYQTSVCSTSVHCSPFRWPLCKTVQYWLSYRIFKTIIDGCVTQSILHCFAPKSLQGCTLDWCRTHRRLVLIRQNGQFHRPSKCTAPNVFHSCFYNGSQYIILIQWNGFSIILIQWNNSVTVKWPKWAFWKAQLRIFFYR